MSFQTMIAEVRGAAPKLPIDYAKILINRARADIYRQNLWSFQLYDTNWTTPALINQGTCTTVQGSNQVVFDSSVAGPLLQAAYVGGLPTPLIQRQFRVAVGTIYNIWAWNGGTFTATLDRPYQENSATLSPYSVMQCYFPAPYPDHLTFVSVRDMINFIDLFTDKTRAAVDQADPQRTWYYFPTDVVYYQNDHNPASATYGYPMYELWGLPQSQWTYQLYGLRKGLPLVNPGDTLPLAIGEDCLTSLAKKYAYEWAEANKGDNPRDQGPDYRFLLGETSADYQRLFKAYRRQDRETVDNWFSIRRSSLYGKFFSYYSSISGTAYPGYSMGG